MVVCVEDNVFLDLEEQLEAMLQRKTVFIADMGEADDLVAVTSDACTNTGITVVVTTPDNAWLIGNASAPSADIVPKGILRDMTGGRILSILNVTIQEIFPGMVVSPFVLIRQSDIKATLIESTEGYRQTVDIPLCMTSRGE